MAEKRDLVIIGGGPAGLTAAIYAARKALDALVLEAGTFGGQMVLTHSIENYPGFPNPVAGVELANLMAEQAKTMGAELRELEAVTKLEFKNDAKLVFTAKEVYETKALIIATGSVYQHLNIPGEKEFTGRGVSYCATCDAPFYKGKIVTVVGGGNTALQDALYLSEITSKVFLIHRRSEFRADEVFQNRVFKRENIELVLNSEVKAIKGKEKVEAIDVFNKQTSKIKEVKVDGIFIAIGQVPVSKLWQDAIKTNERGYIIVNDHQETNIPGVFAAGDVTGAKGQIIIAAGQGAIAALSAYDHIKAKEKPA